jgi:hypothetical protein
MEYSESQTTFSILLKQFSKLVAFTFPTPSVPKEDHCIVRVPFTLMIYFNAIKMFHEKLLIGGNITSAISICQHTRTNVSVMSIKKVEIN